MRLTQKAKAKAKSKAKAKGQPKAKAKSAAKAKAKASAKKKATAKTKAAKAKASVVSKGNGGDGRPKSPLFFTIDDVMAPTPFSPRDPLQRPCKLPTPKAEKPMKRPAAKPKASPSPKKPKVDAVGEGAVSQEVKKLVGEGLVPHTFGGRAKPAGGWALEKYAKTTATFHREIQPTLGTGQKNKAQAWFSKETSCLLNFSLGVV